MATFFGTVQGGRGQATRLGHDSLKVTAQSFEGSVIVELRKVSDDGDLYVVISLANGSKQYPEFTLFSGPIRNLFNDQVNFGR